MAKPMPKEDKSHPVHKARLGALQLAVWANEHQTEDGELRTFHTVTLERNYKDKNDAWQKTSQLRESDLGEALALIQNAQQFLIKVE
ncbi:MAG: hypothetical protein APF80_12460 [Alphaproteobacteria bacterium BRH_c36]|nr:MAG: hypothetical protein APF80_12460 [Alphaproteobacteria bacterium BRH_c36]